MEATHLGKVGNFYNPHIFLELVESGLVLFGKLWTTNSQIASFLGVSLKYCKT